MSRRPRRWKEERSHEHDPESTIIGRVRRTRQVGTTLRVNIASSYSRKDNRGEWVERTRWNEVTVLGEFQPRLHQAQHRQGRSRLHLGLMGRTKWKKDEETFYGVTLAAERIERLCKGPNHGDDKNDEPQERSSGPTDDFPTSRSDCSPEPGRPRPPRLLIALSETMAIHGLSDLPHRRIGTHWRRRRLFHYPRIPSAGSLQKPKPILARRPLASPPRTTRTAATEAFRLFRSAKARSTTTDRRAPPGGPLIRPSTISTTAPSEETAMTRKTEDVPRPPRTGGRANAHQAEGHRYSAEAVQREIAKDRRIKPKGARLIYALLRGRG